MLLPPFNSDGLLPTGDYLLSFEELRSCFLVQGSAQTGTDWDTGWRLQLTKNLEILATQLWKVGVTRIFVNGSFVEDKDHPNDIDGYFECELSDLASGELQHRLNALDEHKVWTWDRASRRAAPNSVKNQLPMWHTYRVELYPHFGQGSGIPDKFGHELQFPSAFRLSRREHKPKGIVLLKQTGVNV
jgi:hypothetical protein